MEMNYTPRQTTFPSRKTVFPLFAEEVGNGWLQLINLVTHCGTVKGTRSGDRLTEVLGEVELRRPRIPVISNVDAQPHTDPDEIRRLLARQVCGVVEWQASMEQLLSTGVARLWEVGPGRVLRGLLKRIDRRKPCRGVLDG